MAAREPHSLRLLLGGGSPEEVKVDLEPLVDAGVDGVVLVADLLRGQTLLSGLVLRGRPVLVGAAHEQQVPAAHAAVPLRRGRRAELEQEPTGRMKEVSLAETNKQV